METDVDKMTENMARVSHRSRRCAKRRSRSNAPGARRIKHGGPAAVRNSHRPVIGSANGPTGCAGPDAMMHHKEINMYRQGDILLKRAAAVSGSVSVGRSYILATGEATGH